MSNKKLVLAVVVGWLVGMVLPPAAVFGKLRGNKG